MFSVSSWGMGMFSVSPEGKGMLSACSVEMGIFFSLELSEMCRLLFDEYFRIVVGESVVWLCGGGNGSGWGLLKCKFSQTDPLIGSK